ncbi:MAG: hypothetical protein K1Y02_20650 [Candidatus Hydrogenedentes bacterium]|nr:hypothetical protein [Candidatus Hydrogenedentota bacterium]
MAGHPVQNYANHKTFDNSLYVIALLDLAAIFLALTGIYFGAAFLAAAIICVAVSVIVVLYRLRAYAVRVQDRVIRLETRLRLERVLPETLRARIPELTLPQLIGVRFASDAELPDLVAKVLAENIATADAIKRLVKHWQADYLRV